MFKECLNHNIVPFVLKDVHRDFYYRGLNAWNEEKGYLLDTIGMEQDMYKVFLEKFNFRGNINDSKVPKNKFEEWVEKEKWEKNSTRDKFFKDRPDKPKSL